MFAFFGLGLVELLILGAIALVIIGVLLALVIILAASRKRSDDSGEVAELRAEIRRLNDEIDRLKSGAAS